MKEDRDTHAEARDRTPWYGSTFALSLAGGVLLWAAFPPANLWLLGWVAPAFWLHLILRDRLPGRRPYWALWSASAIHWLLMLHGIRLAHWANNFGWLALSGYLAVYLPAFVALTRVAVHPLRLPVFVAAPAVWTGLELARGHLITGFSMALLGHTQVRRVALIQIADLFGAYGVSFVVVLVAACFAGMLRHAKGRRRLWPAWPAVMVVGGALIYGHDRLADHGEPSSPGSTFQVALLQGTVDTRFEHNPQRNVDTFREYWELMLQARDRHPGLDLIVWPESAFTENHPELVREGEVLPPDDGELNRSRYLRLFDQKAARFRDKARKTAEAANGLAHGDPLARPETYLLVGTESVHFRGPRTRLYNSALLIDPAGQVVDRYYKMHPVMFGEYLPFGDVFPWIYRYTPMTQGLTAGKRAEAFIIRTLRFSPSICFESTVPHLIRRQVRQLTGEGTPPDVLINVTNDGWFFGTAILDLQLACAVFRSVENRLPMLIAANTGISAWIDRSGRIRRESPRREKDIIFAEILPDRRPSWYREHGDVPAGVCLAGCLILAVIGAWGGIIGLPSQPSPPILRRFR